jgi:ferrous iron transport protein B
MSAACHEALQISEVSAGGLPRLLNIAIAGNPNAGKTSLFNALTGLRQKVANYPGVTVERKIGRWMFSPDQPAANLIDLPGLYSLEATSLDEEIATDILLGHRTDAEAIDAIVVVVDATNLVRNLFLATQLIETGKRIVLALTMFDVAERGNLKINLHKMSDGLGVPIIPVVARSRRGLTELGQAIQMVLKKEKPAALSRLHVAATPENRRSELIKRYAFIERLVSDAVDESQGQRSLTTERIDQIATHKILGPLLLLLVMVLVFQAIFSGASLPMTLIESVFGAMGSFVRVHFPAGLLTDLLVDGVIAGVGGVLVFLPQILMLFFFIAVLEDSGYMARAAFLMDRIMRSVGLHGKAFVPLLSSFACAVPGIMATRTIENPRDRIATIMIAPFMSCSARLPVYTLMIAAFFSGQKLFGFVSIGGVMILGMYLLGLVAAVVVALLLKRTVLKAPPPSFLMELPPYRAPNVRDVGRAMLMRAGIFVKRAGTVILAISILLWALAAFPRTHVTPLPLGERTGERDSGAIPALSLTLSQGERALQLQNSFVGRAGQLLEPVIRPLGFDWKIGIGLITSFAARETIISTLSVVYNAGETNETKSTSLIDAMHNAKRTDGSPVWTPLVGLSVMIFFLLACQCMSTVAIVRRETNSWRWPLFMVGYMFVLAYVASFLTYQGGRLLGFS